MAAESDATRTSIELARAEDEGPANQDAAVQPMSGTAAARSLTTPRPRPTGPRDAPDDERHRPPGAMPPGAAADRRLQRKNWSGAYWGIRQQLAADNPLTCPPEQTMALASLPTRLDGMTDEIRDRLIDWGYAAADAAIREWLHLSDLAPAFPRAGGVG